MKRDLVGPKYFSDPYYQSAEYKEKLTAAQQIERSRQDLVNGIPTSGALAYARFLNFCANDATLKAHPSPHRLDDADILREYPFLGDLI